MEQNGKGNLMLRAAIAQAIKENDNFADEIFSELREFGVNVDRRSIAKELQHQYDTLDEEYAQLNRRYYMSSMWRRFGRVFYWLVISGLLIYIVILKSQIGHIAMQ
jgi:hypothetical protein